MNRYIRTFAEINTDAIEHNFNELKKCVNTDVKLCAVIKADGYGHGAVEIARLLEGKADYFAVATTDEAIELRNADINTPIIILTYSNSDDYEILIKNNITLTVFSYESAAKLNATAKTFNIKAKIHIAVDTGMTRIGFDTSDTSAETIKNIAQLDNIEIEGIFSHYACADMEDKTVSIIQKNRFCDFIAKCESKGIEIPIKHLCNSAGISEFNEHFNMIRMGISLYGLYPSDEVNKSKLNLIPAMTLKSHIIRIMDVAAGEGISYGHTYKTTQPRTIATIAAGYADGYPRALSNNGRVLINGCYAPITGRVCMDQFMVDITDIPDVKIDDEVILFGSDGEKSITAEEIGNMSMSFNYEILCSVSRRIPRVYTKNSERIKIINYLR